MCFSPVSAYKHILGPPANTLKKSTISWDSNVLMVLQPHTQLRTGPNERTALWLDHSVAYVVFDEYSTNTCARDGRRKLRSTERDGNENRNDGMYARSGFS